jgi:hypothetical protein
MLKPIARTAAFVVVVALVAAPVFPQSPQQLAADATCYMAMGDSLTAGFKLLAPTPLSVHGRTCRQPHPALDHAIQHPAADDHGREPQRHESDQDQHQRQRQQ